MNRSQVNTILMDADKFMRSHGVTLPPFAYWTLDDFIHKKSSITSILSARLGWDITDYGAGNFDTMGLFLFTTRNGSLQDLKAGTGMCYAEKIMISRQDQLSPMHRHIYKTEDIINRGGATLAIQMFESDTNGKIDPNSAVNVMSDGQAVRLDAGDVLRLAPGQSVTLYPGNWHKFWGDGGDVLIGEVSTVNDDKTDNIFAEPIGRFSTIAEDTEPQHLLVSDYDSFLGK